MRPILVTAPSFILAAFLVFMGIQKFAGDVPIFSIIEANVSNQTGLTLAFIEPFGRYLTGALEFAAAILLVARRFWGGLVATLVSAGAVAAHLTFLGISTPESSAPGAAESPALFIMALGALALSGLVTYLARPKPAPAEA